VSRRVALATYGGAPQLAPDDQLLLPALAALGVSGEPVVWSDDATIWTEFDAVVIRSCWDYHLHFADFLAWLGRVDASGTTVWNSSSLVRWNSDKRYLLDLARRGVATIPTMIVPRGRAADVEALANAEGWTRFVLKPTVSASGYETYALRTALDDAARDVVMHVTTIGDALLQPFVDEVSQDGEYSFTFIDGAFSHATLKRATPGGDEFRVQTEHGGSVEPVEAPAALIEQATHVLRVLPEPPLYARVDGIARGSAFLLMELELIEPNLFLGESSGAAERLAAAIVRRLGRPRARG
jgi:glutathione synthase/RimK-type ligase-like ATP-grasp enzyme